MLLPTFEALQSQLDAMHRFMQFRWVDPRVRVLRPALEHGRRLVEQHQPHMVLVDFTGLPAVSIADELWLSVHWFPHILKVPLRQVAVVSRPEHLHNQMVLEALLWLSRPLVRFQIQIFDDAPSALEWLLPHEPAARQVLQTEWHTHSQLAPLATDV